MIRIWFFKVKSYFPVFSGFSHDCRFGVEKWNGKGDQWGKKDQMSGRMLSKSRFLAFSRNSE